MTFSIDEEIEIQDKELVMASSKLTKNTTACALEEMRLPPVLGFN